ncbi:MAG: adenylate/guanylate cyclase domain-containing protein [Spirochaetes bacterium]|nr:adenylate/guanylate cyclase domain-containing protein [Spirochaetota bacterium]
MKDDSKYNLFQKEDDILKNAKSFTSNNVEVWQSEFKKLSNEYRALLKQSKTIVRISDNLENRLNRTLNDLNNINEISKQISLSLDFDTVFQSIAKYLTESYQFSICLFGILSKDFLKIEKSYSVGNKWKFLAKYSSYEYPIQDNRGLIEESINKNQVIEFYDLKMSEVLSQYKNGKDFPDVKTVALIPINVNKKIIGFIVLMSIEKKIKLKVKEKKGIEQFANHIAVAVKNSKLFEIEEKKRLLIIEKHNKILKVLNKAYSRFVPKEFLQFLGKRNINEIKLGDQIEKRMTILFSDIRSFATLSENMTPQDNFNFLNTYLKRMGPIIRNGNGFIDKYIGDAIMAIFPENPENAIKVAINMQKEIERYNKEEDALDPLSIGIGIHTGNLMLGTIGEEERMETTVISDSVNLASRIEALTKMYGASILISESSFIHIEDPASYKYRFLDIVKVKGKNNHVSIFEILNGLTAEEQDLKMNTKDDFEMGIINFRSKKFEEAKKLFIKVSDVNQKDKAVEIYLKRCNFFIEYGVPDDWDGSFILNTT